MTVMLPLIILLVASSSQSRLGRGLENIGLNEISDDIHYIASDAMRGRDTVSKQQRLAARFFQDRLVSLGFEPGCGDRYLHKYPLLKKALDPDSLSATIDGVATLKYGADYIFTKACEPEALHISGGLIFCGEGGRNDFDGVSGNWAVCDYKDQNIFKLRGRARHAGALGLVLAPRGDENLIARFASLDKPIFEGIISWPNVSRRRAVFPVMALAAKPGAALGVSPQLEVGALLNHTLTETRHTVPGEIMGENVAGFWPGSDPGLTKEVIIVSAHYDHLGTRKDGEIFNGADDNGSGTTSLLALAKALSEHGPMQRSILLLWVSGEEKGQWGSKAWVNNPTLPKGFRPCANINIDTIASRLIAPNVLCITPSRDHAAYNELTRTAERFASEEGFDDLGSADSYYGRSDHAQFAKLGIPVCLLFGGMHEDYHQPTDTVDKIDCDKIRRVTRMTLKMISALQTKTLNV